MCSGHEIDRDRVLVPRYRQRCRLAGRVDELEEVRPSDLADVEPGRTAFARWMRRMPSR
jgi:hypothetical protein